MADFFENDEITKEFDSKITARIFGYMKPYHRKAILCLVALILSTAGELVIPILVRRTVDRAIVVSWRALDIKRMPADVLSNLNLKGNEDRLDEKLFVSASQLAQIPVVRRRVLESEGILEAEEYYLFSPDPDDEAQKKMIDSLLEKFPNTVNRIRAGTDRMAIPVTIMHELPAAQARKLRKSDAATILGYAIFLAVVLVLVLVSTFAMISLSSLVALGVMKDLRIQLFKHTATRSLDFLSKQPVGRLVTRLTSDVETINQFFTDVLIAFIKDASVMVGALIVLFILDWRLGLIVSICLPPVLYASAVSRKKARDAFRKQRQWTSRVNSFLSERITGVHIVKLFVREAASLQEFEDRDKELMRANLGEMYVFATFRPLVDFFATMTTAIVLVAGASLFKGSSLSLGTIIAFVNLVTMFYQPLKDLSEKYTLLQSAMAGGERIFSLLDAKESIPDRPAGPMPVAVRGHIEFRNVWFAYKDEDWVLKDLSFTIEPGQMIAIVGYTGAGKTTIANLVPRFWDIQKGQILIDGIPVKDFPLDGLRRAIQPVAQDVFLFSGTIQDNIMLGADLSDDRIHAAAKAVSADEFISLLPSGYQTLLSEGASNLSQGQRQLISFARVLAHSPSVIILDEATSSIDTETERLVQKGLEGLLAGRTSLVIAHRLSTIRHADRIIVLSRGRVAESGTHEELIRKKGLYWNLYRLQYGGEC